MNKELNIINLEENINGEKIKIELMYLDFIPINIKNRYADIIKCINLKGIKIREEDKSKITELNLSNLRIANFNLIFINNINELTNLKKIDLSNNLITNWNFEDDIFKVNIKSLNKYQSNYIINSDPYYVNQLV
jgi:hypothetical protein